MSQYVNTTDEELIARADVLISRLEKNLKDISPTLLAISRDREEVAAVVQEITKRGLTPGKDATSKVQ